MRQLSFNLPMTNIKKILEAEIRKLNITWGTTNFWPGTGRLSQAVKIFLVTIHITR